MSHSPLFCYFFSPFFLLSPPPLHPPPLPSLFLHHHFSHLLLHLLLLLLILLLLLLLLPSPFPFHCHDRAVGSGAAGKAMASPLFAVTCRMYTQPLLVPRTCTNVYRIPYSGYFPGGKIFVDVQIFFHSWFNVRGVRRSRPHVFKIICVVIPCI